MYIYTNTHTHVWWDPLSFPLKPARNRGFPMSDFHALHGALQKAAPCLTPNDLGCQAQRSTEKSYCRRLGFPTTYPRTSTQGVNRIPLLPLHEAWCSCWLVWSGSHHGKPMPRSKLRDPLATRIITHILRNMSPDWSLEDHVPTLCPKIGRVVESTLINYHVLTELLVAPWLPLNRRIWIPPAP